MDELNLQNRLDRLTPLAKTQLANHIRRTMSHINSELLDKISDDQLIRHYSNQAEHKAERIRIKYAAMRADL